MSAVRYCSVCNKPVACTCDATTLRTVRVHVSSVEREIATLRAKLAAAERVVEAARAVYWKPVDRVSMAYGEGAVLGSALAAYDAARGGK